MPSLLFWIIGTLGAEDTVGPQLFVTFDGIQRADGDDISRQPVIFIQVYDNSVFSIEDDTTNINLFLDHNRSIGHATSQYMSYAVDNHPFYLKLLAWHALLRTRSTCTSVIVEKI